MTGHPWENLATTKQWIPVNENKKWVKYACAWSFIEWAIAPGVTISLVYGASEYKVKEEDFIPDINGDQSVTMSDIRIACKSYGLYDEGVPVYEGYEPPWWWRDQSTLINPETGMKYGPYPAAWVDMFGCQFTVFADPGFDTRADLAFDGHINIKDLRLICKYYLATLDC